jgi:hypothetical protein
MTTADDSDPMVAPGGTPSEEPVSSAPPFEESSVSDAPGAGEAPQPDESTATPEPEPARETLVDAIADLLQMFVNWLRAEAADIMRDKVVLPVQQLGLTLASASAAGCLVVIGLCFLFVALLLVLADWLGWPGALALVGSVILIGASAFTYVKMRSIQK